MGRLEKAINRLTPKLTAQELLQRMSLARQIAEKLVGDEEWKTWIKGIYLYGSIARGNARHLSDIDLAIVTEQTYFHGLDFSWVTGRLAFRIEMFKADLAIHKGIKIRPMIVAEQWLHKPNASGITKPEVVQAINTEGILLVNNGMSVPRLGFEPR